MSKHTRNKLSNKEVIGLLFQGEINEEDLTEFQEEYLNKVKTTHGLLLKGNTHEEIHNKLEDLFKISYLTRLRLLREVEDLYGSYHSNKETKRHIAANMALEAYQMAKDDGDFNGMVKATNAYIKATGVEHEDPDLPDFSRLQPNLIINVLPEQIKSGLLEMLSAGAVDLNTMPESVELPSGDYEIEDNDEE